MANKTDINLIPNVQNPSPDYYCTWQTQLFATSDGKPEAQRAIIGEKALFSHEKPFGWAYFYENCRNDLFIVMDDSWDVPLSGDKAYYGSLILNDEKFPSFTLNSLSSRIKELDWKGLGGWVCAQESEKCPNFNNPHEYWKNKLEEAHEAGIGYWKVDWGANSRDVEFRKMLSELCKIYAPDLVIEHGVIKSALPFSDVYRTYDVPAIASIPMTMEKLSHILKDAEGGIINCEDEAYIAAAGGFAMGIMRHPYSGALPDGKADMSFPNMHRNLKTKIFEITRAVHWHRIAPAFELDGSYTQISEYNLEDTWNFENKTAEIEEWWFNNASIKDFLEGDTLTKSAPGIISRNTNLPKVSKDETGVVPFVVASKNPNGVFSVATCGRTQGRRYFIPLCDICVDIGNAYTIGVFGEYKSLILENTADFSKILIQDLAHERAFDITEDVTIKRNKVIIPGCLIHRFGTMAQPLEDTSEPGAVIKLIK